MQDRPCSFDHWCERPRDTKRKLRDGADVSWVARSVEQTRVDAELLRSPRSLQVYEMSDVSTIRFTPLLFGCKSTRKFLMIKTYVRQIKGIIRDARCFVFCERTLR
jgi:hypothetical protein